MITKIPLWRIYGLAWLLTAALLIFVLAQNGTGDLLKVLVLAGLEITFSFDNAVINARILEHMSPRWRFLFLTVGIAVAVFGVRVFLPLVIVGVTANLGLGQVVTLALYHPAQYADHLLKAQSLISAFGGIFLLMIFLDFVFETREIKWLKTIEEILARLGKLESLSVIVALILLLTVTLGFAHGHEQLQVLIAGSVGLVVYLVINSLDALFSPQKTHGAQAVMKVGLIGFLYLELIDASFSLDGVIGAFAITSKVLLIAVGLGIGALYVRALTVHMLQRGMLTKFRYMEHGAHYAIGILAVLMLASIRYEIPEFITGLSGVVFIATAILHSYVEAKSDKPKPSM